MNPTREPQDDSPFLVPLSFSVRIVDCLIIDQAIDLLPVLVIERGILQRMGQMRFEIKTVPDVAPIVPDTSLRVGRIGRNKAHPEQHNDRAPHGKYSIALHQIGSVARVP